MNGNINPSNNNESNDITRLGKLYTYFVNLISNYSQFKLNLGYKNQLITELLKKFLIENSVDDLSKLPDLDTLYDKQHIEDIMNNEDINVSCQELLENICKFLVKLLSFKIPILDLFVERNLERILKSDELLSVYDKYELFKKDNVKSKELETENNIDERAISDNDVDVDSVASDVDEIIDEKGEEALDTNDNIDFSNDGFDYDNQSGDEDGDGDGDDGNLNID